MNDFEAIAATLRRQRKDIDELMESTASRSTETAALIEKIDDLRRRVAKTEANETDKRIR